MLPVRWLRFAAANLLRNRRRSSYTIVAIAVGYAAVNIFGGFTDYIFKNLGDSFVYTQANGHLTVFKKGFLTQGRIDPLKFMIEPGQLEAIHKICSRIPHIALVTPQLQIMGLLSNGRASTIFIGMGRIPSDMQRIQADAGGMLARLGRRFYKGRTLDDNIVQAAGLTYGLAEKLELSLDSDAIAIAPTVDGRVNALDLQVFQTFSMPIEELNDKVLRTTLKFAQSLYDTDCVDRVTILLDDGAALESTATMLRQQLDRSGLPMEIKTWQDLNPFYTKVKKMFNIIFLFIFIIVFTIAVTSVVNTLSMAVIERTREIGTLRALGLRRSGIVRLFALESAMLGGIGCCCGIMLTAAGWLLIRLWHPLWVPPNIVTPIPLEVYLVPGYMAISFAFLVFLSTLSAILPARRAAVGSIVEALGHV